MTDETLDFRFGWRWLLPVTKGHAIRLFGFSTEEEQFWREAMQAEERMVNVDRPEMLLVDGDHCADYDGPSVSEINAARVVCVVTGKSHALHWQKRLNVAFPQLREYCLLPAANPRVVVPLKSSRQTIAALGLHRPGRLLARIGLLLACALAVMGNFELLRGRVLLIATRESDFLPQGAVQADCPARFGVQNVDYALYLGTPDANRKTMALPLGCFAQGVILKVAATPKASASLKNEADALETLGRSSLATQIPKLINMVESGNSLTLYQEYRPRKLGRQRR